MTAPSSPPLAEKGPYNSSRPASFVSASNSPNNNDYPNVRIDEEKTAIDGYVVDADAYDDAHLKKTPDGRIALIPQPSDSPEDPLNWSQSKKALTLGIIAFIAFLPDYTAGTGIVTLIPQTLYVGLFVVVMVLASSLALRPATAHSPSRRIAHCSLRIALLPPI